MTVHPPFPPTPSRFHDQAWKRDRGHDAMQAAFLDFLRERPIACLPLRGSVHREVEAEKPLYRRGQIVSYVDACEILTVNFTTIVSLFEIKPRIDTVFGIVRQLKATESLARHSIEADQHHMHLVVLHDDPKIGEMRAEWPLVWAWGVTFDLASAA